MTLSRRGLLGAILASPAIIRTPGLLMPVKRPLIVSADGDHPPAWFCGEHIEYGYASVGHNDIADAETYLEAFRKDWNEFVRTRLADFSPIAMMTLPVIG